jgi:hypothetical protein
MKYLQPKPPGHHKNGGKRGNADSAPSVKASINGIHFFVGAGASHRISNQHDPDFPLGSHLFESFKQKIITDAETGKLLDVRKSWARENFSNHNSIDDFLETANSQMVGNLVQHHHGGFAVLKENSGDHGRSHVFLKFELEALILLYHPIT